VPQFLSDEWITEAKKIREGHEPANVAKPAPAKINLVVTEVPFGEGSVNAHMDTTSGELVMDLGHLDAAEATLTTDYDTARASFVDNNPQAGMQAFMAGKVKVTGDMTKLMALMQGGTDMELAQKIQAITE
jgi:hypothetical protein